MQVHASVRTVCCIEGLAGGTFEVTWTEEVIDVLFHSVSQVMENGDVRRSSSSWHVGDYTMSHHHKIGKITVVRVDDVVKMAWVDSSGTSGWMGPGTWQALAGATKPWVVQPATMKGLRADTILRIVARQGMHAR